MEFDLPQGLHDLGHEPAVRASGIAVPDLLARVRRRRTARRTAAGATATCLVVAVAAAGVALADHRRADVAPAVPTTTTSATPTVDPAALPAGDPPLPFGVCGSVVGTPADPAAVPDSLHLDLTVGAATVAAGSQLDVTARFEVDDLDRFGVTVVPTAGPRFLVVKDGVVVATDDISHGTITGVEGFSWAYAAQPVHSGGIDLVVCQADGTTEDGPTARTPLPAGDYELWAVAAATGLGADMDALAEYWTQPVTAELIAGLGGTRTTATAGPVPFTVIGDASVPQPHPQADATATDVSGLGPALDVCTTGAPAMPVPATSPALRLELAEAPLVVAASDPVPLTVDLVHDGPGVLSLGSTSFAVLWAVQDGAVVGSSWQPVNQLEQLRLGNGARSSISSDSPVLRGCWPDQTALPPGEYELYVSFEMVLRNVVLDDGTTIPLGTGDGSSLVSGPIALKVTE